MIQTLKLYQPHPMQLLAHESTARYRVIAFGRQGGKSTYGNNELIKKAWEKLGIYWFILPTYAQAKVQFRRALKALTACGAIKNKSESELFIELLNGSVIHYKSGDKPENLRTETLNGVIIDEVREQSPTLWSMVIRPMLATTGGWAVFTSTTNGFDEFYDLHQRALTDINWYSIQAPSTCNPLFTQEELEE